MLVCKDEVVGTEGGGWWLHIQVGSVAGRGKDHTAHVIERRALGQVNF